MTTAQGHGASVPYMRAHMKTYENKECDHAAKQLNKQKHIQLKCENRQRTPFQLRLSSRKNMSGANGTDHGPLSFMEQLRSEISEKEPDLLVYVAHSI